jgi:hypothetical protein
VPPQQRLRRNEQTAAASGRQQLTRRGKQRAIQSSCSAEQVDLQAIRGATAGGQAAWIAADSWRSAPLQALLDESA